jgi:hypothetical protein
LLSNIAEISAGLILRHLIFMILKHFKCAQTTNSLFNINLLATEALAVWSPVFLE